MSFGLSVDRVGNVGRFVMIAPMVALHLGIGPLTEPMDSPALSHRAHSAIVLNAALWTAGNALTSGGFLSYFAADLGARGLSMAVLMATPELVGLSGLASRGLWRWSGDRRRVWLMTTLIARMITFLIPCVGLFKQSLSPAAVPWVLIGVLAVAQAAQGIATTLYFSWLADLVPAREWGRLFARRNIAALMIQLVLPILAAWFRDAAKKNFEPAVLWWVYAAVFSVGAMLLLASLWPMMMLPHPQVDPEMHSHFNLGTLRTLMQNRNVRGLLAHSWCLALANGVTQAVFFQYQIRVVKLSLTRYYVMASCMVLLQIMTSAWAGRCRTAVDHRWVLFQSTLITSMALGFWMLADASAWWWLFGAFACWGAFGAVNVAGPNLMLCQAPPGDNAHHLALFRQVAGVIAGLSGILGGWWLDQLLSSNPSSSHAYHVIFVVSWIGRALAAWVVLGVTPTAATAPVLGHIRNEGGTEPVSTT